MKELEIRWVVVGCILMDTAYFVKADMKLRALIERIIATLTCHNNDGVLTGLAARLKRDLSEEGVLPCDDLAGLDQLQ